MRLFLHFLLAWNFQMLSGFYNYPKHIANGLWNKKEHISINNGINFTGRVFVTMFGYPSKCEKSGVIHSCTLSFACWMVGGSSESGCGASPWIVACCVTTNIPNKGAYINNDATKYYSQDGNAADLQENNIEFREGFGQGIQRRSDIVPDKTQCGLASDRILRKRIIGGKEANFGQFPWQVYIKINSYQCGGVLVSRMFVATAAHCILTAKLNDILVYLGELDTQDTGKVKELAPAELHRVRKKIIHPSFKYRPTQPDRFDLALLEMVTEAGYALHISPICLPVQNLPLSGRKAVVAGWGKVKPSNDLTGTNILRSVTVPILDTKECLKWHKIKQIYVELHQEMICAGHQNGQQDACLGDSGGPLILLDGGRWTLVGITSAGFGCGEAYQPGIYHKIPVTTDWIQSVLNKI